ncbi:MAG: hypothetical protein KUG79_17410 [Pseudomonadales bacterium]|nr:hypothetical protein [Pseudomonadales bacterium]
MYLIENIQSFSTAGASRWVAAETEGSKKVVRLNHSALAMQAAKAMPASRQKSKTGHIVCLHLLKMLAENGQAASSANSAPASFENPAPASFKNNVPQMPRAYAELEQQHEKQYALAFHG